ncbi:MAG: Crp/Fnr family transcriptional regulator [Alphaproteobacteria bacterium]
MQWDWMTWVDMVGYLGGGVTLWGMYRKTMIPLRLGAVAGNAGFIAFGFLAGSYPTLLLHSVLLPLNALRAIQMMRLIREIREAADGSNSLDPLLPFMQEIEAKDGEVLFRKDDVSDRMVVIKSGSVVLDEIGARCGPGDVLGEIGAFTSDNKRTCTAICEGDCSLYSLSYDNLTQIYYQNPRFGMFLIRVVVARLLDNWHDAEARAKAV